MPAALAAVPLRCFSSEERIAIHMAIDMMIAARQGPVVGHRRCRSLGGFIAPSRGEYERVDAERQS